MMMNMNSLAHFCRYIIITEIVLFHCNSAQYLTGNINIGLNRECDNSFDRNGDRRVMTPCKKSQQAMANVLKYVEECLKSSDGMRYKKTPLKALKQNILNQYIEKMLKLPDIKRLDVDKKLIDMMKGREYKC